MNINKVIPFFSHCKHLKEISKVITITNSKRLIGEELQKGYLNFYDKRYVQPYVPIMASGPWILTNENKIIYDCGGYGMLGLGHNPDSILKALSKQQVMANIMTPNESQKNFKDTIDKEIKPSYDKIVCLNSGSEVNTLAMRIANIHSEKKPVQVSLKGSFHGRTEMPASISYSCRKIYENNLEKYQKPQSTYFIEMNNNQDLIDTFEIIKSNNEFPEITVIEPVMGEGNPGIEMKPDFYNLLRKITKETRGLLLVDSIQAGFRCKGELSITKYPGFLDLEPPDMESFSKVINSGQFPLSVLALTEKTANIYNTGLYGNTMTTNPRALDVSTATFKEITTSVRENIVLSGEKLKKQFKLLENKYKFIENVTGTGLLLAIHLEQHIDVIKIENNLRKNGLNVIHGGKNALRFTPWFKINDDEINFIIHLLENEFNKI